MKNLQLEQQRKALSQAATQKQMQAAEPEASVWVSASAGTGKTFVLTRRLLKLMVTEALVSPSQFLAVTYTKAAAAEMQNRLRQSLSRWAVCSDQALEKELHALLQTAPTAKQKIRARQLFTLVLDTPGGLNISTIHAFCQLLLQQFPQEAGLEAQFKVIEGAEQEKLMQESLEQLLLQVSQQQHALFRDFSFLNTYLADSSVAKLLRDFIFNRGRILKLLNQKAGVQNYLTALKAKLNLKTTSILGLTELDEKYIEVPEQILAAYRLMADDLIHHAKGKKAQAFGQLVADMAAELDLEKRQEFSKLYQGFFLTADGGLKKFSGFLDKKTRETYPDLEQIFEQEQQRLFAIKEEKNNLFVSLMTQSFLMLGQAFEQKYAQQKHKLSALDFDDLIYATKALLAERHTADWVKFKMDHRLTHILLDEAQDSDQDQWRILESMISEYYAGQGQKDGPRSYFVVGDVKQAIYRFRGAERQVFDQMHDYMQEKAPISGRPFHSVRLDTSFRSGEAVVSFVDALFSDGKYRYALDGELEPMSHKAFQVGAGGRVTLWPLEEATKNKAEKQPWELPDSWQPTEDVYTTLFEKTAAEIHQLLNSDQLLYTKENASGSLGAPISAGDIMILLRSRSKLPQLIAALNRYGIMHSGADTLILNEEPMVQDLLALCRFMALPEEDLLFAQILKSPLVGFSDEEILELRQEKSTLWQAYCKKHSDQAVVFKEFIYDQYRVSFYELMHMVAQKLNIEETYLKRYANQDSLSWRMQIADVYNAFMQEALSYSQSAGATPLGFVHQFNQRQVSLKRETGTDEPVVRIMTAHRSKGLEAPIVFMPDAGQNMYEGLVKEKLLWDKNSEEDFLLYKPSQKESSDWVKSLIEQEKERIFEDEMRLLYVALTRARERVYIGGVGKTNKEGELVAKDSWYEILAQKMAEIETSKGIYEIAPQLEKPEELGKEETKVTDYVAEDWLKEPAVYEQGVKQIQASHKISAVERWQTLGEQKTMQRGSLVHKLLEQLKGFDDAEKELRGMQLLAQLASELTEAEQQAILAEALAVFEAYPDLFSGLSEVDVAALFEQGQLDAAIDLLKIDVQNKQLWVIDFKTDRFKEAEVPKTYKTQLAWYKRALSLIFKEYQIKTALLWTYPKPDLQEIEVSF